MHILCPSLTNKDEEEDIFLLWHEHGEYGTEGNRGNDTWLSLILPVDRNIMAARHRVCVFRYCFHECHHNIQTSSRNTAAKLCASLSSIHQSVRATHRALRAVVCLRFGRWCSLTDADRSWRTGLSCQTSDITRNQQERVTVVKH